MSRAIAYPLALGSLLTPFPYPCSVFLFRAEPRAMSNRNRRNYYDYDRSPYDRNPRESNYGRSETTTGKKSSGINLNLALVGGVFVIGVAVGILFSSSTNTNPTSIDSRSEIDRQAPNPELCQQLGASAIVSDMRMFITLNPFNVFVSQPIMQPGCVLRQNNWSVLEQRQLVNSDQVKDCKRRMNTFGYTGDLGSSPTIDCIYQNDSMGNLFLNQPGLNNPVNESDNF